LGPQPKSIIRPFRAGASSGMARWKFDRIRYRGGVRPGSKASGMFRMTCAMDVLLVPKIGIVGGPVPSDLPFVAVIADDMNAILQKYLGKAVGRLGFRLMPLGQEVPPDIAADSHFMTLYDRVRPFTMTSPERLYALYQSVHQVIRHDIPGDFVECGVWKGGSCMMMALLLDRLGDRSSQLLVQSQFLLALTEYMQS